MDEAVVRRPWGGRAVLRAQLERLAEVASLPGHDSGGPVRRRRSRRRRRLVSPSCASLNQNCRTFVYIEQLTSALYLTAARTSTTTGRSLNELSTRL